jgi:hypothetical protein
MKIGCADWTVKAGVTEVLLAVSKLFSCNNIFVRGPLMVAQWLRYCVTNQKVAGSIPDGVTGIFH